VYTKEIIYPSCITKIFFFTGISKEKTSLFIIAYAIFTTPNLKNSSF